MEFGILFLVLIVGYPIIYSLIESEEKEFNSIDDMFVDF